MKANLWVRNYALYINKIYYSEFCRFIFFMTISATFFRNGPVIHFWSMRYEARHKQIKVNGQSTSCSKTLLKNNCN